MKTAAIDGVIYGNEWQTIYDSGELGSAQTSITIPNLDGNTDKEYRLIVRGVYGSSTSGSFRLRINGDSAANYGYQYLQAESTSATAYRDTAQTGGILLTYNTSLGDMSLSDNLIYAKSGYVRTALSNFAYMISGTTVYGINSAGWTWNNTADNITSLMVYAIETNGLGIGTRIILMRRADRDASTIGKTGKINAYGKVKGCFQKIYDNTLAAAATTLDITGLDGNTDVVYQLICRFKNDYSGSSNYFVRPNNDTGANYGRQGLYGINTTAGAYRNTGESSLFLTACDTLSSLAQMKSLIFAKSGYLRTFITEEEQTVSSTTVGAIALVGGVWNDTGSNINSLTLYANQTNGLGVGTHIELWAYRP